MIVNGNSFRLPMVAQGTRYDNRARGMLIKYVLNCIDCNCQKAFKIFLSDNSR